MTRCNGFGCPIRQHCARYGTYAASWPVQRVSNFIYNKETGCEHFKERME